MSTVPASQECNMGLTAFLQCNNKYINEENEKLCSGCQSEYSMVVDYCKGNDFKTQLVEASLMACYQVNNHYCIELYKRDNFTSFNCDYCVGFEAKQHLPVNATKNPPNVPSNYLDCANAYKKAYSNGDIKFTSGSIGVEMNGLVLLMVLIFK